VLRTSYCTTHVTQASSAFCCDSDTIRDIDAAAKLMASAQTTASTLAILAGDNTRLPYMQQRMRYMATVLQVRSGSAVDTHIIELSLRISTTGVALL
jgi:hypothetical protein